MKVVRPFHFFSYFKNRLLESDLIIKNTFLRSVFWWCSRLIFFAWRETGHFFWRSRPPLHRGSSFESGLISESENVFFVSSFFLLELWEKVLTPARLPGTNYTKTYIFSNYSVVYGEGSAPNTLLIVVIVRFKVGFIINFILTNGLNFSNSFKKCSTPKLVRFVPDK